MTSARHEPAPEPDFTISSEAYHLRVINDSMAPAFFPGDIVTVDPQRPVSNKKPVVVWFADGNGLIRELIEQTSSEIRLRQYRPEGESTFPMEDIASVQRVVRCTFRPEGRVMS